MKPALSNVFGDVVPGVVSSVRSGLLSGSFCRNIFTGHVIPWISDNCFLSWTLRFSPIIGIICLCIEIGGFSLFFVNGVVKKSPCCCDCGMIFSLYLLFFQSFYRDFSP